MNVKLFIIFSLIVLVVSKVDHEKGNSGDKKDKDDHEKSFKEFKKAHKKEYKDEAKAAKAFDHYSKNLDRVKKHNARKAAKLEDYEMEVYSFMDEDLDDVIKTLCGTKLPSEVRALPQIIAQPAASTYSAGPPSTNFTDLCLSVVNQGQCGCCWSFASIAHIETLYKKYSSSNTTPLSQQHLVDCDTSNSGCNGGWPRRALDYLRTNGITADANYPYKAVKGTCKPITKLSLPPICQTLQYNLNGDETLLKNILAATGPVVVAVYVSQNFMAYRTGIFSDLTCPFDCSTVNHAVLLVGYGTDAATGKQFWLIRNSWGASWGERGYIRIARGIGNNCLTACFAMFSKLC